MITNIIRRWWDGLVQGTVTVAAAGSSQATATFVGANAVIVVTGADGTKGVRLPPLPSGPVTIINQNASNALAVYPSSGDKINNGNADTAMTQPAKTAATYYGRDGEIWYSVLGAAFP